MPTVIADDFELAIPEWVTNLAAFRRWADEPEFPPTANIWWLHGRVWADMTIEDPQRHRLLRGAIDATLLKLSAETEVGRYLGRGSCLVNVDAGFAGKPDGMYVSVAGREQGRYRLAEAEEDDFGEIDGSPDIVLEVLSDSSATKDLVILRKDYFLAGVGEYWLVDVRLDKPAFDILRRGPKGFTPSRKQGGWIRSPVFGRSFRLVRKRNRAGNWEYRLLVK